MTFLNPFVLFGLLAASIPIIIHLLNLRKLKVVEFSSLQFLKEMQKNKMRKIRIKQILLLILRTLIIVFLVFSFSRPTIKNINIAGLGSEVKNTIVIIIDDTPSMSVQDKRGELITQAKKLASKILELTEDGDEVYLLKFSELNPLIEKFEPSSKYSALKELERIEISDVSRNFYDVFVSTSKILENAKNLSKEVYIITDFQTSNLSNEKLFSNLKLDKSIDRNTRIYFFKLGEKDFYNISIDSLLINNRIFELNKPVSITASINNYSNIDAKNTNSNLFFNDKKVSQKGIDLKSKSSSNFTLTGQANQYGFISGKFEIEEDDFIKDNNYFFGFYVPEKIKVLMVSETDQDLLFINLVLSQTLDENSEPIFEITHTTPKFINSFNLMNYDLIITSSLEKIDNLERIITYVNDGGNILILPSDNSNPIAFGRALERLGLPTISGVSGSKDTKTSYTRFKEIDLNHPIFSGIFVEKKTERIESPKIYYSFNYKAGLKGKDIITLENNYSFLVEEKLGRGNILLFTSAMNLNWNEFPIKPIFVPLINRIGLYSNSGTNNCFSIIAGENVKLRLPKLNGSDVKLVYPDGRESVISLPTENEKDFLSVGILNQAGIYKLFQNDKIIALVSINLDSRESNLSKLDEDDLFKFAQNSFPNCRLKIFNPDANPEQIIKQERYGTELWKFFLILALICLALEMIIVRKL